MRDSVGLVDWGYASGVQLAALSAVALGLGCGSGTTDGNHSAAGAGREGSSGGHAIGGGGSSNLGVGGEFILTKGGAGAVAASGGSSAAGVAGAAGESVSCPDLHTAPVDCPPKVYPDDVLIRTQADADALAGYTELGGRLMVVSNVGGDLLNLDALRCLQKIHFELEVTRVASLVSLDGLRELGEVGGWVTIDYNKIVKLGCGLRKLSKVGTHGTRYVEFEHNAELDRVELPLLDGDVGHFRVDDNAKLQTIVGSPAIVEMGQFFISGNPVLTSVSGFDGLKSATEVRLNTNPMLPICQMTKIVAGLTAPPSIVDTSGNLGDECP